MPVLAAFAGLVFKMYFMESEHNPPHIHCEYGEFAAAIDIRTLQILDGILPSKAHRLALAWMKQNQEELLDIWETQTFRKLPPLEI